jgi:pimeloyl-ACP methyl ester carboxylesterase
LQGKLAVLGPQEGTLPQGILGYSSRMSKPSIILSGCAGHAIAALVEGPEGAMPVMLAHGGGQTKRAWKRVTAMLSANWVSHHRSRSARAWAKRLGGDDGAYDILDFAQDLVAIAGTLDRNPRADRRVA